MTTPNFSLLSWTPEGFDIGPWIFKQYPEIESDLPPGTDPWFWFFKPRSMVEDYMDVFAKHPNFKLDNAMELGMWDGGSAAFWSLLTDANFTAVDLSPRGDSGYFKKLSSQRPSLRSFWGTDAADEGALNRIIADRRLAPLDLVIDDASHFYKPTRRSFEILFPKVRTGGLYIIEDWQWSFEAQNQSGDSTLATKRPLVDFIHELLALMASAPDVIRRIDVYPLFVVVERGHADLATLDVDKLIRCRARPTLRRRVRQAWHLGRMIYWRLTGA
jgi:hypothetical protein